MYAVIDIETSGGKFNEEKIIEIAIIIFDGKKIKETFSRLINPGLKVDYYVQKLTGIKSSDLKNKDFFKKYAKGIYELIKGKIIIGHNVEYDYRVLKNELKACKIELSEKSICTIELCKMKYKDLDFYNLKFLSKHFDIELNNHHRALDDAKATLSLFKILNNG